MNESLKRFLTTLALGALIAPFTLNSSGAAAQTGEPTLVHRVPPQYPARALQRGRSGAVTLRFTIDANGATKDIEVVESTSSIFEDAAVKALSQWRYVPLIENGKPVERPGVQTVISFAQ